MKRARWLASLFLLFAAIGIFQLLLRGDGENKRTKFTFPEAVRVGGTILQPGTYWFTIKERASTHNIVVITNEAKDHVFATVFAIPNYRLTISDRTILTFWETPRGSTLALRSWTYPADNFVYEFAYPRPIADQLSAQVHAPVPVEPMGTP